MRRAKYPISCTMLTTRKLSATVYIHRKFKTDGEHRKIQKTQNDVCTRWTQYDVGMTHHKTHYDAHMTHPKHNTMLVWHSTNTLWCVTSHTHVWCLYDITDTLHYKHGDTVRRYRHHRQPSQWPGHGLENVGQRKEVFLFSNMARPDIELTYPHIQWISRILSSGIRRPRREAVHSVPSTVVVKNY